MNHNQRQSWHQADKYGVPKIAFINKVDRIGADFFETIRMMKRRFLIQSRCPSRSPGGWRKTSKASIDLIRRKTITWDEKTLGVTYTETAIPPEMQTEAEEARDRLIEALADLDDAIADQYLRGTEIQEKDIVDSLRKLTVSLKIVPVVCGRGFAQQRDSAHA